MTDRAFIQRVRDRIAAQPSVPAGCFYSDITRCFCLVGAGVREMVGANPWERELKTLIGHDELIINAARKLGFDDIGDATEFNDKGGKEAVLEWLDARLAETAGDAP